MITEALTPVNPFGMAIRKGISKAEGMAIVGDVLTELTNALKPGSCFAPIGDRVYVQKVSEATLSRAGLHIPETSQDQPCVGVILGVGQGRVTDAGKLIPMRVSPGMVVVFGKYAGTGLPVGAVTDEEHLILAEDEIFGVLLTAEQAAKIEDLTAPPLSAARIA